MKIKKFNESEIQNLSNERTEEIIESLTLLSTEINQKVENIESLINELNNFRDTSKSKNDQIDDSVANLQIVRSQFSDSLDKMNNAIITLKDYIDSGRKYIY